MSNLNFILHLTDFNCFLFERKIPCLLKNEFLFEIANIFQERVKKILFLFYS